MSDPMHSRCKANSQVIPISLISHEDLGLLITGRLLPPGNQCLCRSCLPEPGYLNIILLSSNKAATFLGDLWQVSVFVFYKSSILRT